MTIKKSDYIDYVNRTFDPCFRKMEKRDVDITELKRMHLTDAAKLHVQLNCYCCDAAVGDDSAEAEVGTHWGCEACNDAFYDDF